MKRMWEQRIRRLAMSSTLVGAAFVLAGPVAAQDHGLLWDGPGLLDYTNPLGTTLEGTLNGAFGRDGSLALTNAGIVRGITDSAIVYLQAGSSLGNTGLVEGAQYGLTTSAWFNAITGQFEGRAIDTIVTNSGTIRGLTNDGVRLIGGGSVINSGLIEGLAGGGADGVSMFRHNDQDVSGITSIGTVDNQAGGIIFGNRIGIILSVGGLVNNAGSISGNVGGVTIQDGLNEGGKTGTLSNSGSISGGDAVAFYGALLSADVTNSGSINGTVNDGIANYSDGPLTIDNLAVGSITGTLKGIHAAEGAVIVTNAGTIRGNGTFDGFGATPDGGISLRVGISSITNSGSISGARFGITTYNSTDANGQWVARVTDTTVINLAGGSIIGDTDDGVRLIGGGTITNAGIIEGRVGQFSDGVSMFALQGQDTSGQTGMGTITNETGGTIVGNRFGISSGGGVVIHNAGTIIGADFSTGTLSGFGGGVLMQAGQTEIGKIGTITNSGTISAGSGVLFGAFLASGTLTNSGTITGTQMAGVENIGSNAMTIDNLAGGSIAGARMGVRGQEGAVIVTNAGTITGQGGGSNGAIVIEQGGSSISNSGLIEGWSYGVTANPYFNSATGLSEARATNTLVDNSGAIRGLNNDGVRLQGGGTVINSGIIEGLNSPGSDGVSMFRYDDQDVSARPSIGTVRNLAGGLIAGDRFGIILSGGGSIENDGTIRGNTGGLLIQAGNAPVPYTGTLINRGTIENGARFNDGLVASVANSGTIQIDSPDAPALESLAQISVVNTGTISSTGSTAIRFGVFNDRLTLGLGSQIIGLSDGGDGIDTLALDAGAGTTQSLGSFQDFVNFETLEVISGSWSADGDSSGFTTISMLGGSLAFSGPINPNAVFDLGVGTLDLSGGGNVTVAGLSGDAGSSVILASGADLVVNQLADAVFAGSISGAGSLVKAGDGRLNLTGTSSYTGPTFVSGGTLAVNGSIVSPVTIEAGATLAGTGTTGTVTINPGGTFAPGNSIGTISVIGTLNFASGSSFEVEADASGAADRINVTGNAVIGQNVMVNVLAAPGTYRPSTKYVILNASGKITGLFAGVTSDLAFLEPKLGQTSKTVELTLKRKDVSFSAVAADTNQAGVAAAVEAMGEGSALHEAVLLQSASGAQAAFSALSGSFFGSLSNQLVAGSGHLQAALQPSGTVAEQGISSWSAFTPATRSASSADYRSGFSLAGGGLRVSMAAGWLPQERVATGNAGTASMETHYSGAMLGYAHDGFSVAAGAGFSWHRIVANRSIAFAGFADGAQARYRGATRQLFAEAAHTTSLGPVALTPFAGYSDIRVAGMDIREAGSGAGLLIDGQARRLGLAQIGIRTAARLPFVSGVHLSARFNIAWQKAWGDLASVQNSRFASNGAGFAYQGQQLAASGLDIDAGLALERGNIALTAGYRRSSLLQRFDDGAELGMRLRF
jgi:fibronectin-binding autotransporter adhesin